MVSLENLKEDFDLVRQRILHIGAGDKYYDVRLSYRPFRNETDLVKNIEKIGATIQLLIITNLDLQGKMYMNVNVYRYNDESGCFNMQTMNVTLMRVYTDNSSIYDQIFPSVIENNSLNNIEKMYYPIKRLGQSNYK